MSKVIRINTEDQDPTVDLNHDDYICRIADVVDVSLLNGDAALDSVNYGIIECTCDRFHECQYCNEQTRE